MTSAPARTMVRTRSRTASGPLATLSGKRGRLLEDGNPQVAVPTTRGAATNSRGSDLDGGPISHPGMQVTRGSCHDVMVIRNVTITLDEEVARGARIRAAERKTRVSCLVGELLRDTMLEDTSYDAAMREYLARPARKLRKTGTRSSRRADLDGR
jgi:hypothetical protein